MSSLAFFARPWANGRILPGSAQEVPMCGRVFNGLNMRSIKTPTVHYMERVFYTVNGVERSRGRRTSRVSTEGINGG
jgi:hypothetical protein